ncbi:hypothetical protein V6N13_049459 [Hibiscus sabdariffa]
MSWNLRFFSLQTAALVLLRPPASDCGIVSSSALAFPFPFLSVSRYGYSTMINGYCKVKRFDEAMEFFHEISQKGRIPDNITYNTLMQYMLQLRRVSTANEFLRKMLASGQVPDMGLLRNNCNSKATQLLEEMVDKGFSADICTATLYVYLILGSDKSILMKV